MSDNKSSEIDFEYHADLTQTSFQSCLGFMPTRQCNIECDHCITNSSPLRKEQMPKQSFLTWIEDASRIKAIKEICFTGGEPFLLYDYIRDGALLGSQKGLKVAVISNGFWASTEEKAMNLLSPLRNALSFINISLDRYHRHFVSPENVKNALKVAKKLGMGVKLRVAYLYDRSEECLIIEDFFKDVLEHEEIDAQPILPLGRAASKINPEHLYKFDPTGIHCTSIGFPVIYPDGTLYACCGPSEHIESSKEENPLAIGNLYKNSLLELVENANSNFLIHYIRSIGPAALLDELKSSKEKNFQCNGICDCCLGIFSNVELRNEALEMVQNSDIKKKVALKRMLLYGEPDLLKLLEKT